MINMRNLWIYLLIAACASVTGCKSSGKEVTDTVEAEASAKPDVAMRIQECSKIYTSEYQVSKIIVQRDEKRMKGKVLGIPVDIGVGGTRRVIALPIEGVLKAYVDMSEITEENIIRRGDSIEIILPDPKIVLTSTRINTAEIREKTGFWRDDFNDAELTRIQQAGRDSLIAEVPKLGLIANARHSATRTLLPLLGNLGYDSTKVRITFAADDAEMSTMERLRDLLLPAPAQTGKEAGR